MIAGYSVIGFTLSGVNALGTSVVGPCRLSVTVSWVPARPSDTLPDPEQRFRIGGMISPGNA